jgi:hypothetical protein
MNPFETFNASFVQQPVLLWCAAALGLAVVALRGNSSPSVRAFCLLLGLVPFFDAWLTADQVAGIGALAPTLGVVVALFFVIVGDFRVFLFLASSTADGTILLRGAGVARAFFLSLVVPIVTAGFRALLPDTPWRARATFLFYEVAFVCLLLALRGRGAVLGQGATLDWGRKVIRYVLTYYALWAIADAVILFLHLDVGYLLRVVANVLYYGGLLAAVSWFAPAPTAASASRATVESR